MGVPNAIQPDVMYMRDGGIQLFASLFQKNIIEFGAKRLIRADVSTKEKIKFYGATRYGIGFHVARCLLALSLCANQIYQDDFSYQYWVYIILATYFVIPPQPLQLYWCVYQNHIPTLLCSSPQWKDWIFSWTFFLNFGGTALLLIMDAAVAQFVEMGYSAENALNALQSVYGDFQKAMDWLLEVTSIHFPPLSHALKRLYLFCIVPM